MAVSLLGDGIFLVAVAWQAYTISDRPSALALVGLAISVPQLVLVLLGGAISDRVSRRRVLLWADTARAVAIAGLAGVVAVGSARLYELCLVAAVTGTASAFAAPALDALVPELVPEHELIQANAIDQIRCAPPPFNLPDRRSEAWRWLYCTRGEHSPLTLPPSPSRPGAWTRMTARLEPAAPAPRRSGPRRPGGIALRPKPCMAVGHLPVGHVRLSVVHRTHPGSAALRDSQLCHAGASVYGMVLAAGGVGALIGAVTAGRRDPAQPMLWVYGWWTFATLAVGRLRVGDRRAGPGRGRPRRQRGGGDGNRRLGHPETETGSQRSTRSRFQHRLVHFDRPPSSELRPDGSRGRRARVAKDPGDLGHGGSGRHPCFPVPSGDTRR